MKLVVLESPFAGKSKLAPVAALQRWLNRRYARRALRDCVLRGESPIASHMLLTQPGVLRDEDPLERAAGIACGHEWMRVADAVVFYIDKGMSGGMTAGLRAAKAEGLPVEFRRLD